MPNNMKAARAAAALLCALAAPCAAQGQAPAPSAAAGDAVRVAVIAIRDKQKAAARWRPTIERIAERVTSRRFEMIPMNWEEMRSSLLAGDVDFFITNPAMYVQFEVLHGVRPVASLMNAYKGNVFTRFGSVVLTKAGRGDLRTLASLSGKRFGAVHDTAWGGWFIAKDLLQAQGIGAEDLAELKFFQSHDAVVRAVLAGEVDAGTVRTGILEQMIAEGAIQDGSFALLARREHPGFPLRSSSVLYPEWPFAALEHVGGGLKRSVLQALLDITPQDAAAAKGRYHGWTVPQNYQAVRGVLQRIKAPPYEHFGEITISGLFQQYRTAIIALLLFLVALAVFALRMKALNSRLEASADIISNELQMRRKAQAELEAADLELKERNAKLQDTLEQLGRAQEQMVAKEKLAALGQLTAGVAHEIKNPLNFIKNFSELNVELCEELDEIVADLPEETRKELGDVMTDMRENCDKVTQHSKRADNIVRHMLAHSRERGHTFAEVELNDLVDESVDLAYHGMRSTDREFNAKIERDFADDAGVISAVPQDLQRVVLNLVNNACYSVHKRKQADAAPADYAPEVRITTRRDGDKVVIIVRDNGEGISPENLGKLFEPFFTTKPTDEGTGLGLSMTAELVQGIHQGDIEARSEEGEYAEFVVTLPVEGAEPAEPAEDEGADKDADKGAEQAAGGQA